MPVKRDPQLENLIQQKVDVGGYPNASAVVREALRLMDARERQVQRLQAALGEGEEGEAVPWTPELMEQLTREADEPDLADAMPDPSVWP
ncbi:MAG TPA: type II toxin-antitoxin system ParD family antitoxin [Thermomicrobiales bacterium]|jgi:putative addiction module CopG family antidote